MSVQGGLRRTVSSSRASLASLSATSCSSSERTYSHLFGDRSREMLKCSSSTASNLLAASMQNLDCTRKAWNAQQCEPHPNQTSPRDTQRGDEGWISIVALQLSRLFVQILNSIYPEVFYLVELLRAMLISYRDECVLAHQFGAFHEAGATHFSSFGKSEEFQPKAKLIVSTENDGSEQWGHFADFDTVDDQDVIFLTWRYALSTLNEEVDEGEDDVRQSHLNRY